MPERGKNLYELIIDLAAQKVRSGQMKFSGQAPSTERTREVFLAACQQIAEAFEPEGFKYARSGPHFTRRNPNFSFQIYFQSSPYNIPGELVEVNVHANVLSRRLSAWRRAQTGMLHPNDYVAGGQIGNLLPSVSWMVWNLADPAERETAIADIIAVINRIALPYFTQFEDIPAFCDYLVGNDVSSMGITLRIEFLLCFADRDRAETCLHRFLLANPKIYAPYLRRLADFRRDGLPSLQNGSNAYELAYDTIAYGLTPPEAI